MKKHLILLSQLLIPLVLLAQGNTSSAYSVGKVAGIIVVAGFVVWGISWWRRRKK